MAAVQEIKDAAEEVTPFIGIPAGYLTLKPPVRLIEVETGNVVHASMLDGRESTEIPTVRLKEKAGWWSIEGFTIPETDQQ
jgi:hypothetical protein